LIFISSDGRALRPLGVKDDAVEDGNMPNGGLITAVVGRDNLPGAPFHPEKSQATGLRLIGNFLRWRP
jgi:imidazole glycerol-phosphate synthase subunit HisH